MYHQRKTAGLLKSALLGAATLGALSLAGVGVAQAGQIDFNFGSSSLTPTSLPTSTCSAPTSSCEVYANPATFSNGGISVTANGYYTNGSPPPAFLPASITQAANSGGTGTEVGLGVHSSLDVAGSGREIDPGEYLVLDMSSFINKTPYSIDSLTLTSIQSNEGGSVSVYSTSSPDLSNLTLVQTLNSGTGGARQSIDFTSSPANTNNKANYLIITAADINGNRTGNIAVSDLLIDSSVPTKAPEPGSLALLGTGLLGLGIVIRRRRRKA